MSRQPMPKVRGLKPAEVLRKPGARPPAAQPAADHDQAKPATGQLAVEGSKGKGSKQQRRTQGGARAVNSTAAEVTRQISVSVPMGLAGSWRARARADRKSQAEVLFDAVVAAQDGLTALVAARKEMLPVSDGLFLRPAEATGERATGVSLRVRQGNVMVLDRLVKEHAADSRSQLVTAALAAYLEDHEADR